MCCAGDRAGYGEPETISTELEVCAARRFTHHTVVGGALFGRFPGELDKFTCQFCNSRVADRRLGNRRAELLSGEKGASKLFFEQGALVLLPSLCCRLFAAVSPRRGMRPKQASCLKFQDSEEGGDGELERRVEVPLENVGRANPSRFHILFRVEPYVGFFARRECQAETNLHVGGPMTFGFLLTHTPGEGLCAHHLEPLWEHLDRRFVLQILEYAYNKIGYGHFREHLERELALEQATARLRGRFSREDAAAHEPPVGLRLNLAFAEKEPARKAVRKSSAGGRRLARKAEGVRESRNVRRMVWRVRTASTCS